ncbi:hypothetical protein [Pseudactinotalea sp.]|uniref:hypothetical protein n=1 Tax=Pseudactinotalea sp. TaxID=1926260 RepID=UPI003B3B2C17
MSMFSGGIALVAVAALVALAILVTVLLVVGRRKHDWAGDRVPPPQQVPPQPGQPQQPGQPPTPPRSIDDSERFREQNRPTDPPAPA